MQRLPVVALLLAFAAAGVPEPSRAQDLEPRAYWNTPVGMNFVLAGYGYTTGSVLTDPSLPLEDAKLRVHAAALAYARSVDVLGLSGKVDAVVPYACADGRAIFQGVRRTRSICGLGDPRFRVSLNFVGAPALSLEEFAAYEQDFVVGASLRVVAPLGQYNDTKLLNIGTNRWSFKPELGLSKVWGSLAAELAFGAETYTDNDDFLDGKRREQDPIYSVQAHLIYRFRHGIWGAVDGVYFWGGRTTVDGVRGDDLLQSTRVGATLAVPVPVGQGHSLKLYGSSGVSTRFGGDFDLIGVAWQYRWGGRSSGAGRGASPAPSASEPEE